jgi:hypothetical protein
MADVKAAGIKELGDKGWGADSGLAMEDLSDLGKTRGEKMLFGLARIFQQLPKSIESNNRYGTLYTAIDGEMNKMMRAAEKAVVEPDMEAIKERALKGRLHRRADAGWLQQGEQPQRPDASSWSAVPVQDLGLMNNSLFWGTLVNSFKRRTPEMRTEARRTVIRLAAMTTLMAGCTACQRGNWHAPAGY